jgi:putative FmdB family regulatory protein
VPIYVYECRTCQAEREIITRFGDGTADTATCKECGGEMQRKIFPPALSFKGSGWTRERRPNAKGRY